MIQHIHIITDSPDKVGSQYVISQLSECWQKEDIKVTFGPLLNKNADLGILHVDATWVATSLVDENAFGVPILNSKVLDISKRRISSRLLNFDSQYHGPVIIKTNANCFGIREFRSLPFWSLKRLRQKLAKRIPWQITRELPKHIYPVLPSKSEVPAWVWTRDDLVVEEFTPEMEGDSYVLRVWLFFGNQDYVIKMIGSEPVVKAGSIIRYEILDSVPDALRSLRAELQIDFGKFDYVMVNNQTILLDVNKTPTVASKDGPSENLMRVATGIKYYEGESYKFPA